MSCCPKEKENITACRSLIQEPGPTQPPTLLTGQGYVLCPVMLKILQARFNSMWTENFQMFKLDLEMAEEPEIKLPAFVGS